MQTNLQPALIAQHFMDTLIKSAYSPPAAEVQRHSTWVADTAGDVAAKAAAQAADVLQYVRDFIPADASWAVDAAHELKARVEEVYRDNKTTIPPMKGWLLTVVWFLQT